MTVELRRADPGDSGILFKWVNEPDSLAGKLRTTGPIAREQHDQWFAARLQDRDTFIWIIEADREPAGQLRLMKNADAYEVDIYIVRGKRRFDVASLALASGIRALTQECAGAQAIRALVKTGNVPSQRLFERAGFVLATQNADHMVYELTAS